MSELEGLARKAGQEAALRAGKDAARRAFEDLTLSDEERAARDAAEAQAAKTRRWKLVAIGVVGLCLVVGVIGMLASLWPYFLGAGIVAALAFLGWLRVKPKLTARKVRIAKEAAAADAADKARAAAAAAKAELVARERAAVEREQALEDELAALKRQAKSGK